MSYYPLVLDNIIFSLQRAGGGSMYWYELVKRLKSRNDVVFFEQYNENIFRNQIAINVQRERGYPLQILRYLPFTVKVPAQSIFHSSLYRVCLQKNVTNITTVHDFTYEYYRKGLARVIHSWQKNFAVRCSDGVICVSENTKKDLLKFIPDADETKIKVVYNGISDEFFCLSGKKGFLDKDFEFLQSKKFVLFIGDRSPYKNFSLAVRAVSLLPHDYCLVIVGGKPFSKEEISLLDSIGDRVHHFTGIASNRLNILYNNAFCTVYPSSYEGFGIPVAEAMRAGCPVITTKLSSIPEVAGDAALYLDDLTPEGLAKKITLLNDPQIRNNLVARGLEQSAQFSWDRCFRETYEFYEEIHEMKWKGCILSGETRR